jgi:hypothetical protein
MNIDNVRHLNDFLFLGIRKTESLLVGSATLALLGIRENRDLDVFVTELEYQRMAQNYHVIEDGNHIYFNEVSIYKDLPYLPYTFEQLLHRSILHKGFHFMNIDDVVELKTVLHREKDIKDLILIRKNK